MTPEESLQAIEEYKAVYEKVFGVKLNDDEAILQAQNLLQLFVCLTEGNSVQ